MKSLIEDLAIMNKRTLSDEEYLKLYQEKFGKLTESAKKQVLDLYHHTITEEEWKDIVDAFMQFKDWEPPFNEISNEGLDMDTFTDEEIEYLKKYHKLTEEEKEEIIKERRKKFGKHIKENIFDTI
jgi:hypothetical protein